MNDIMAKTEWGDGPWQDEPDNHAWMTKVGLPALVSRSASGAFCGYVAIPHSHPLHGLASDVESSKLAAVFENRRALRQKSDNSIDCLIAAAVAMKQSLTPGMVLCVHGGVMLARAARDMSDEEIPNTWREANLWLFGFDCMRGADYAPASIAYFKMVMPEATLPSHGVYRDIAYVTRECEQLARQLRRVDEICRLARDET